ncbi:hypothetical protein [Acinetobacter phage vB_AbaM_CP14]|nr:hypothetical protein [Acinetobacter phage vB_AbaM_CP14]
MVIVIVVFLVFVLALVVFRHHKSKGDNMPQGLQAWDENGKQVVDLTDRQLTLFTTVKVRASGPNTYTEDFTLQGISPTTTVAYIETIQVGTDTSALARKDGIAATVVGENTFRLSTVIPLSYTSDYTVNFYYFR